MSNTEPSVATEPITTEDASPAKTGLWSSLRGIFERLALNTVVEFMEEYRVMAGCLACIVGLIVGGGWLHRNLLGLILFGLTTGGGAIGVWRTKGVKSRSRRYLLSICVLAFSALAIAGWFIPRVG